MRSAILTAARDPAIALPALPQTWQGLGRHGDYDVALRDLRSLTDSEQQQISTLLAGAYPDSEMARLQAAARTAGDCAAVAAAFDRTGRICGVRHVRFGAEPRFEASQRRLRLPVLAVGRWFAVAESTRGQGLGQALVAKLNRHVFRHCQVPVVFGSSLAVGSIRLYRSMGAGMFLPDIHTLSPHASAEDNARFFEQFMADRSWTAWRGLPRLRYAWTLSPVYRRRLSGFGYKFASAAQLG